MVPATQALKPSEEKAVENKEQAENSFTKNTTISVALVVVLIGVFALAAERVTSLEVNLTSIKESQAKLEMKSDTFATKADLNNMDRKIANFATKGDVEMIVEAKIAKVLQDIYRQQAASMEEFRAILKEGLRNK